MVLLDLNGIIKIGAVHMIVYLLFYMIFGNKILISGLIILNINRHMQALAYRFQEVYEGNVSLENIRHDIRHELHNFDPNKFPMGSNSASVADLGIALLQSSNENAISEVY